MYESFYGLKGRPFQLNPDPSFYFDSAQHHRAMAFLRYGLHQGEGFIIVTGEVGAGKTTLLRSMLARLDRQKVVAAHLVSTQLDADDTLRMVAAAFGIRTRDMAKADLLLSLEATLSAHVTQGRRCLLIVDEAQNLPERAVEELRMISNFQYGAHALLQTFLVGQPEFRVILQSPHMNQLRQRVIAACHIGPLSVEEVRQYVEHRLKRVGWKDNPSFTADAFEAIHAATGGIPRKVNLLCDRLLLSGYLGEKTLLNLQSVREVASEITGETGSVARAGSNSGEDADFAGPATDAPLGRADLAELRGPPGPRAIRVIHGATAGDGASNGQPADALGALNEMKREMKEFEATLQRVERGNQDNVALFKRLVELMRKSMPQKGPGEGS